jgi:formate hydrogenlyase subunit 6/NADH:ubiquinone oxidoreductase subunit I
MSFKYLSKDITLKLNEEKCVGCGMCTTVCPHRVFNIEERKAKIIKIHRCIECGACMSNCPVGAINVEAGVGCAIAVLASSKKKKLLSWLR